MNLQFIRTTSADSRFSLLILLSVASNYCTNAQYQPYCYWCWSYLGLPQYQQPSAASFPRPTSMSAGWYITPTTSQQQQQSAPITVSTAPAAAADSFYPYFYGGESGDNYQRLKNQQHQRQPTYYFNQWFDAVVTTSSANSTRAACDRFIEQYAEEPLRDEHALVEFINETFYGNEKDREKNAKGVVPSTFHCCHSEFYNSTTKGDTKKNSGGFQRPWLPVDVSCQHLVESLYQQFRNGEQQQQQQQQRQTRRHNDSVQEELQDFAYVKRHKTN